jgi:MFS superfamily sulfate permease-like transporter
VGVAFLSKAGPLFFADADSLIQVARELQSHGTSLALAQVHPPTLDLWRRAGLSEVLGEDDIFPSIQDAVDALTRTSSLTRSG